MIALQQSDLDVTGQVASQRLPCWVVFSQHDNGGKCGKVSLTLMTNNHQASLNISGQLLYERSRRIYY